MKPIIIFIGKLLWWLLVVVVGIIYSILYLIYDPKGLIKEKKKYTRYIGMGHGVDWKNTLSDEDFWCPLILS